MFFDMGIRIAPRCGVFYSALDLTHRGGWLSALKPVRLAAAPDNWGASPLPGVMSLLFHLGFFELTSGKVLFSKGTMLLHKTIALLPLVPQACVPPQKFFYFQETS